MFVSLVNPQPATDVRADCALTGVAPKQANAEILHHPDLNAFNSFENPDAIVPKHHPVTVEGERIRLDVPALSVITVRVQV